MFYKGVREHETSTQQITSRKMKYEKNGTCCSSSAVVLVKYLYPLGVFLANRGLLVDQGTTKTGQ